MSGSSALDGAHVLGGQAVGERADELGAGAERGLPRGLGGQLLDEADGDHLQAAGRRRGGQPMREGGKAARAFAAERRQRVVEPDRYVGRNRRWALRRRQHAARVEVDGAQLGVGGAEVDEEGRAHG